MTEDQHDQPPEDTPAPTVRLVSGATGLSTDDLEHRTPHQRLMDAYAGTARTPKDAA
jgi:hypothetical protein